jgi:hypothetical protein
MSRVEVPKTKVRKPFTTLLYLMATVLALILSACANGSQSASATSTTSSTSSNPQQPGNLPVVALPGYQVTLFASSTSSYSAPDSLVVDSGYVFIDYQNVTAKDCSDNKTSTIVEYTMAGAVVKTFIVPGHSDGMRADPSTHLLWVTSCEDRDAKMMTIDPSSGTITPYALPKAPHGGGYDDLYFLNGMTFIAASNPTLNSSGINKAPALDTITLSRGQAVLKPVLMGNASATDNTTHGKVTLNEMDPDSLSVDTNNGDLVLVNQAGSELVFLSNPGTPQQTVTRTMVGTQLDDTVWASSAQGRLLVSDGISGMTYWIRYNFKPGTVYTQAPDDSGVAGFVGTVDVNAGTVIPVAIGFGKPTGMLFVPDGQS